MLFLVNRPLVKVLGQASGGRIKVDKNVRIQKVSVLSAEAPLAQISIGANSIVYENAQLRAYGKGILTLGEDCVVGDTRVYSRSRISIGARCVFSWNVFIQDFHPHPIEPELRAIQMQRMTRGFSPRFDSVKQDLPRLEWDFPVEDVSIGDDVWVGANVTILPGAQIGNGCVVATGSVVTRGQYPDRSIIAGCPAKVVKTI